MLHYHLHSRDQLQTSQLDRASSGEGRWCWIGQVLVLRSGLKFWLCFVFGVKSHLSKLSVFRVWGPLCGYQDLFVCKETHLCSSSLTAGLSVRCVDMSISPAQEALRRCWLLFLFTHVLRDAHHPWRWGPYFFIGRNIGSRLAPVFIHPSGNGYLGELHFPVMVNIGNEHGWAISLW